MRNEIAISLSFWWREKITLIASSHSSQSEYRICTCSASARLFQSKYIKSINCVQRNLMIVFIKLYWSTALNAAFFLLNFVYADQHRNEDDAAVAANSYHRKHENEIINARGKSESYTPFKYSFIFRKLYFSFIPFVRRISNPWSITLFFFFLSLKTVFRFI